MSPKCSGGQEQSVSLARQINKAKMAIERSSSGIIFRVNYYPHMNADHPIKTS